ncbi:hypothetical protein Nepgr_022010 [Nepenthes gracilis]|uniref:tRNA-splicing endonuclease subunit Sen54 N-terminal domain-containing protein n=1 Tax=Nepenthes gracilis TaxID=150966 RepID=A0AAD3SZS5_NEPGR|nr:hypothetical protein Nepgr_022010 [Nepenthes gracilis]
MPIAAAIIEILPGFSFNIWSSLRFYALHLFRSLLPCFPSVPLLLTGFFPRRSFAEQLLTEQFRKWITIRCKNCSIRSFADKVFDERPKRHGLMSLVFSFAMDDEDWFSSSGGLSDSEACCEDTNDEELFYTAGSKSKLQFRKEISKACWSDEMGMAEVIELKGRLFTTMGIVRSGKIYCSIEETLFLAEIGALVLVDDKDTPLPLKHMYEKVAEGKNGCSWEAFEVYRHLKSLGYIVGRHDIPWSLKCIKSSSVSLEYTSGKAEIADSSSIVGLLNDLQIKEVRPIFDVYLPNRKFRKSSPGDPSFLICLTGSHPPSRAAIKDLERRCSGIHLRFGHVEHGRVSFFSFNKVELPVLP